jgi:ketosteroid isomerase-like protein
MGAAENKQLIQSIFSELAKGNAKPLVESMDDDFRWIVIGSTKWSKTYEGKQSVLKELFGGLRTKLGDKIRTVPQRYIAEGDLVVVEARGDNTTKAGLPYNNRYCFIFRIAEGRLKDVTEYLDTELVTAVFADHKE